MKKSEEGKREEEHAPVPQTVRKLPNRTRLMRPAQTEPSELRPPRLRILLRILLMENILEVLKRALIVRQLVSRVLRVLRELERGVFGNGALDGLQDARDQV